MSKKFVDQFDDACTTSSTSQIECPYCNGLLTDLYEHNLHDGDCLVIECCHCEKSILLSLRISTFYTAHPEEQPE